MMIKSSIENNLPVMIPFSASLTKTGYPSESASADTAHWATIIGWASNSTTVAILLAQYGSYYDISANELYKSFHEIEPIFPETYLTKEKKSEASGISVKPRLSQVKMSK